MSRDLERVLAGLREQSRALSGIRILACPDCTEKNQETRQYAHFGTSRPSHPPPRSPPPGGPMSPYTQPISSDTVDLLRPPARPQNANMDEPFDDSLVPPVLSPVMSYEPSSKERSRSPLNDMLRPLQPFAGAARVSPRVLNQFSPGSSSSPSPCLSSSVAYRAWGDTLPSNISNHAREKARVRSLSPVQAIERGRSPLPGAREQECSPRGVREKTPNQWIPSATLLDGRPNPYRESDWRYAAIMSATDTAKHDSLRPLHEAFGLNKACQQMRLHELIANRIGVEKDVTLSPKYGIQSTTPQTQNRSVAPTQSRQSPVETHQTPPLESRRENVLVCPKRPDGEFYLIPPRPDDLTMRVPGMPPDPVPKSQETPLYQQHQDRTGLSFPARPGYLEYLVPFPGVKLKPLHLLTDDNVSETPAATRRIIEERNTTPKRKIPYPCTYEGFFPPVGALTPSKVQTRECVKLVNPSLPAYQSEDTCIGAQKLLTTLITSPEHKPRDVRYQPETTAYSTTVVPSQQQNTSYYSDIVYDYPLPPRGRGTTPRLRIPSVAIPPSLPKTDESAQKQSPKTRADNDGETRAVTSDDVQLIPPKREENPDVKPSYAIPRARIRRARSSAQEPNDDTYSFPAFQVYCYLDGRAAASHQRCNKAQIQ
eukprot:GEMP01011797.1.p1 GENE.GEMP01011797.1~~GEMP01011797.1.p1  ORF type:complete len:653 (+),score=108.81 GEMP01011797.1:50-2008(+)